MIVQRIAWSLACSLVVCFAASAVLRAVTVRLTTRWALAPSQRYRIFASAFAALPIITVCAFARMMHGAEVSADQVAASSGAAAVVSPLTLSAGRIASLIALLAACAWIIGATLLLFRFALRARAAARLAATRSHAGESVEALVRRVARRMGVPVPAVAATAQVNVPSVAGVLRPVLLLPPGIESVVTRDQLELIVAHELAHIARRDPVMNVMQALMDALLFFSPSCRALSESIRAERELAADARAADAFGTPLILARALERLETLRTTPRHKLALAADDEPLLRRIVALAERTPQKTHGVVCDVVIFALVAAFAVTNIAAIPATTVDNAMRLSAPAAAFRQEIKARDNAGPFTLHVVGYRAVDATFAGKPFPPSNIRQRGDAIRFTNPDGATLFTVKLQPAGGMKWQTR